jgi:hypothetical protein
MKIVATAQMVLSFMQGPFSASQTRRYSVLRQLYFWHEACQAPSFAALLLTPLLSR